MKVNAEFQEPDRKRTVIKQKDKPLWRDWKFWFAVIPISGIVTGVFLNWFFSIKTDKIHLNLPYAYEYRYRNATHDDQDRRVLPKLPIEIKLDSNNRGILRLGIHNDNTKTIKGVTLQVYFPEGIKVIEHNGWVLWEPNKVYRTLLKLDISNGQTLSIPPIITEFLEPKIYKIQYSITGEDFKRIKRDFLIKAIKDK